MTHFPMTRVDLTKHGNDRFGHGWAADSHPGRHARHGHVPHHAAGSLPVAHILLLSLSAAIVLAAVLLVLGT